jgi:predicted transcriptional regulator
MDFQKVSRLGALLSKDYAGEFFRLLVTYQDISASEAASRLNLHIKTAQDFLDGLEEQGVVSKEEVYEKKRPYYRYTLKKSELDIRVDLTSFFEENAIKDKLKWKIREKKNSGAMFKTASNSNRIASVHFFTGKGRDLKERVLNLTNSQGIFLYHLPFPTEPCMNVLEIIKKAQINDAYTPEIVDIIDVLQLNKLIEKA